jgi:hypothetical protein
MNRSILLLSVALVLAACSPTPEVTKPKDAQQLVDSLVFVQSKAGLCFGVTTTSRVSTSMSYSESVIIVTVDCNAIPKGQ